MLSIDALAAKSRHAETSEDNLNLTRGKALPRTTPYAGKFHFISPCRDL